MGLDSLRDVFEEQINDLRSAEEQLVEALPKMAMAATSQELKQAFSEHLTETKQHLERIDDVIAQVGLEKTGETCDGMKGLIKEGEETIEEDGDSMAKDAALIAAAQRVEHYEIAGYGTVVALADHLGLDEAKDLLGQTLEEEGAADKLLTKIATGGMFKSGVNQKAS
ncbi:MAG TPA: ferritin-like domain-containing protein [Gaiellaceae bacterium]|nr:ferritin-like domain-containing protein [Gaiellaceae bacterium]